MVVVMVYLVSNKSCLTLANPWTVPCQAPLSLGFPRQEYWSGLPFLSPGDLPNPGIELVSPALADGFFNISSSWEAQWSLRMSPNGIRGNGALYDKRRVYSGLCERVEYNHEGLSKGKREAGALVSELQ